MQVLVSHPHTAVFSQAVAAALDRYGSLGKFVAGVAYSPESIPAKFAGRFGDVLPLRNRVVGGVERAKLLSLGGVEIASRLAARTKLVSLYNSIFVAHDVVAAKVPWPRDLSAVYAYEDGALKTFERAAALGLKRVWDLPLPHYRTIAEMWLEERRRWPTAQEWHPQVEGAWKYRRKDSELALASLVVTASKFTRDSVERLGVKAPMVTIPYGFPVDQFSAREASPRGPFRVLSVGGHDLRKGTPYLLEAWKRAELKDAELRLVGRMSLSPVFLERYAGTFTHVPSIPRERLVSEYQAADVLIFPTLGDGFGMVIQEAMCCGTPVLTTRCGGGPECITDGENGWIVEERSVDALVEALRHLHRHRDRTAEAGRKARARAEGWTWQDAGDEYHRQLAAHCA